MEMSRARVHEAGRGATEGRGKGGDVEGETVFLLCQILVMKPRKGEAPFSRFVLIPHL